MVTPVSTSAKHPPWPSIGVSVMVSPATLPRSAMTAGPIGLVPVGLPGVMPGLDEEPSQVVFPSWFTESSGCFVNRRSSVRVAAAAA